MLMLSSENLHLHAVMTTYW